MYKSISLTYGGEMPTIGFGTWEITPSSTAQEAVAEALKVGYRHIDTAKIYGNEEGVGEAIHESGIPRDELFVTTKLWNSDQGYDSTFEALDASLERLGLEYVDLYLIHWPATKRRYDTWRAFEEIQSSGKAKAIGVSNFTIDHLEQLAGHSDKLPEVNQVEFHPFVYEQQNDLLAYCKERGIIFEAYSPLAQAREIPEDVEEIARKYSKSWAQVFLRWCIQHGTVPLPRSQNPGHIKSNFDIFDFELDDEDMQKLNSMSDGERVTWDPAGMGS